MKLSSANAVLIQSWRRQTSFLIALVMSGLSPTAAQSIEWLSSESPGLYPIQIIEIESKLYAAVSTGPLFVHDETTIYELVLYEVILSGSYTPDFEIKEERRFYYADSLSTISLKYIDQTNRWLFAQASPVSNNRQKYVVSLFSGDFEFISKKSIEVNGLPMTFHMDSDETKTDVLGTILPPPGDNIFFIRYRHDSPDSLSEITVKQSLPRPMTLITSMNLDQRSGNMLVFYYNGIAVLDSNLYQVKRFDHLSHISTSDHGNVMDVGDFYYSHGARDSAWDVGLRKMVFHKYDSAFNILKRDTLGWSGQDNYPFINKSLDYRNGEFLVGGHLDGPFNGNFFARKKKYYLAKYDTDLNQIWYKEYGGDRIYWVGGLHLLEDKSTLAYGFVTDSTDGQRYAYIMHVDANGDIMTSYTMPTPAEQKIQVVSPGDDHLYILNPENAEATFTLYDLKGHVILEGQVFDTRESFSTSMFPPGIYPYTIRKRDRLISSGKWLKME
jgi:hypothetical protein